MQASHGRISISLSKRIRIGWAAKRVVERGFTANMNYCLVMEETGEEKGAVLSEITQASRRQYDPEPSI
jgi:hypothetical protein